MEKVLKIYVYEEGEGPIFHEGPCKNIYSSEGRFINEIEKEKTVFRTRDPNRALLYFLPFSVVRMVQYLYKDGTNDLSSIKTTVVDYVDLISRKYPFWNRTLGLITSCSLAMIGFSLSLCGEKEGTKNIIFRAKFVPQLHSGVMQCQHFGRFQAIQRCIPPGNQPLHRRNDKPRRALSFKEDYPSILRRPSPRPHKIVTFKRWKNNDTDIQVYETLPRGVSYIEMLRNSKFCLCPSGDVLNWKAFSVEIKVKDIPRIKEILMGISSSHYVRMQRRVKMAQRHFVVNDPPKRYDVFHMTLHSLWLRRLNIRVADYYS
ncbi:hypothetical protein G4B88_029062 [Cannabis sativa]|uniref:Exostosin GT47 domain-containing protein n=1 Tax=Cannabis sativa TaxID=3483 RepID=A0A7J6DSP2_CANSA|nr:hypothetical protein G4B88_029062 [Cannabis sativa]